MAVFKVSIVGKTQCCQIDLDLTGQEVNLPFHHSDKMYKTKLNNFTIQRKSLFVMNTWREKEKVLRR